MNTTIEATDTAARIAALLHHVFLYDRGNQLRVIEETGLSMTQCKFLLELGGLGRTAEAWQLSDLAELFSVSVPSMSRAIDALVKAKLATRVEDPEDRRVVRLRLTPQGSRTLRQLTELHLEEIKRLAPRILDLSQGLEP